MKKRIIVFYSFQSVNASQKTSFETEAKQVFSHIENFRLNLFNAGHNKEDVVKSLKSQSVDNPIDIIFHPNCNDAERTILVATVNKGLGMKFKKHFHYPQTGENMEFIKGKIDKRYIEEAKKKSVSAEKFSKAA